MLPEDWKKEIVNAVDKAGERNEENEKRRIESQNAVTAPLNRLANEFVGYKSEQREREEGKKTREWATLGALIINAVLVLTTAIIFYCQLREMEKVYMPVKTSADAAIRAATAAERAVDQVGVNFRLELRPYIWVTNDIPRPTRAADGLVSWNIAFTNFGKSPANQVRTTRRISAQVGVFVPDANPIAQNVSPLGTPMMPNRTDFLTIQHPTKVSEEDFNKWREIGGILMVSIKFNYTDIFDTPFESMACLAYLGGGAVGYANIGDCQNRIK